MFKDRSQTESEFYGDVVSNRLSVRLDLENMAERAHRIDKFRIQWILDERRVEALFHFTPLDNLNNLAHFGLLSRANLVENHVNFIPTDALRIDGVNNASCLSLAFPNYKMFFQKRCSLAEVDRWAVLKICPSVLWENPCLFLPQNASSLVHKLKKAPGHFLGAPALSRIFYEPENIRRDEMGLSQDFPTNPQTEILVFGPIKNKKVKSILIEDFQSKNSAVSMLQGSEFEGLVQIDVSVFSPRCDYPFWKH